MQKGNVSNYFSLADKPHYDIMNAWNSETDIV